MEFEIDSGGWDLHKLSAFSNSFLGCEVTNTSTKVEYLFRGMI